MKIIRCEQGTTAWALARMGRPSASQMHRVITPTGKFSSQCDAYAQELLAEQLLGQPLDDATSGFMQRGTVIERKARAFYELQRDCTVEEVGLVTTDDDRVGYSPDGLVGTDGLVEIKVPAAGNHVGFLLGDAGDKYKVQIQTGLWVAERAWLDFTSYNPDLPSVIVRFERDEKFIALIAQGVAQFHEYMAEAKEKLQKYGLFEGFKRADLRVA
jgi:hypothetical protein